MSAIKDLKSYSNFTIILFLCLIVIGVVLFILLLKSHDTKRSNKSIPFCIRILIPSRKKHAFFISLLGLDILFILSLLIFSPTPLPEVNKDLVVEDIVETVYPNPTLDFRLRNDSSRIINIHRVYFKIIDFKVLQSPVGKQEISEVANVTLCKTNNIGDLLVTPLAIKIKPKQTDRFQIEFSWKGERPTYGNYYMVIPVLKTSYGNKICAPQIIHIQLGYNNVYEQELSSEPLISIEEAKIKAQSIDWAKELE